MVISFSSRDLLTVPNGITLLRLFCIPVFLWLLFADENRAAAAWLLGGLGATDWVDGWVARRFDQTSEFGKLFDPTVDRLLFFVAIPALIIDGSVPLIVAGLVLLREAIVALCALTLVLKKLVPASVTQAGKTGTFFLMFAFPMFLGSNSTLSYAGILGWLAWVAALVGLAYGWYSAVFQYLPGVRSTIGATVNGHEYP